MNYIKWTLSQITLTKEEAEWFRLIEANLVVDQMYNTIYQGGMANMQIPTGLQIKITTYTDKQEMLLKLKYGDKLYKIESYSDEPGMCVQGTMYLHR